MKTFALLIVITCCFAVAPSGNAHPATERYIPIGATPGDRSDVVYGEIQRVAPDDYAIVIDGRRVRLGDRTRIWLDQSRLRRPTTNGSFSDCQSGRTVEVKVSDEAGEPYAEWVKIRVER